MTQYALINADNSWAAGPLEDEPTPGEGQRVVLVPIGYGETAAWSVARGAFVDIVPPAQQLISVGRFKLLFTQAERIALRAAAQQSPEVEDFMDLLAGFTDGISLADPAMVAAIGQLQQGNLLTADRATAILAGTSPL